MSDDKSGTIPAAEIEANGLGGSHAMVTDRRNILKITAGFSLFGLMKPALAHDAAHMKASGAGAGRGAASDNGPYTPKTLTAEEYAMIVLLSDWIIPRDARSISASEAGVPQFIDGWLPYRPDTLQPTIRGGLSWLNVQCESRFGKKFADCGRDQQQKIIDRIAWSEKTVLQDRAGQVFFDDLRELVVGAFFSTQAGVRDIPYIGNQPMLEWSGCPAEVLRQLGVDA